jgi:DNA primase large subunit
MKFAGLTHQEIKEFNEVYDLKYTPLTAAEKLAVKEGLYDSTVGHSVPKIESMDFYKVEYKEVWSLVRHRRCYIEKGYAYVSSNDFVSIVAGKHKAIIEKGLIVSMENCFY